MHKLDLMSGRTIDTAVILCGGRGTRLGGGTDRVPKPLVEVGGKPIVWHVLQAYLAAGFKRFLLCTGYKGDEIERYFQLNPVADGIELSCIQTGIDTPTAGRIKQVFPYLNGASFCVTYADGVADIDISQLVNLHFEQGRVATVTVVRPELPFGIVDLDDRDSVVRFIEKPQSSGWINGGFFCFNTEIERYLGDDLMLEQQPLARLAQDGQLMAYRHEGFWSCMDTYKDADRLNDLCSEGSPPWLTGLKGSNTVSGQI